ncbi:MAG: tRNA pseudouridine(55) synthase TruB [Proteobacteria bacterium]|nr:tRNA pseudouridine(55) synthase TruB [Pseudomonadota bacterium]
MNSGLLIIDKPADISSARAVSIIKKLTGAKKVGHTGTLDPFATGVLPCCINEATKISRFFLEGNKKYIARLCLGIETDTQDFTGEVISTSKDLNFSEEDIVAVFKKYEGSIDQVPPAYSALKHKGIPLYKYARQGKPILKPPRKIDIHYIKPININLPEVLFEVSCSAGTYIRTLCADIGKSLGCGGHLSQLRRIESCGLNINQALSIDILEEIISKEGNISKHLLNMSDALKHIPGYIADDILIEKLSHGKLITERDINLVQTNKTDSFIKIVNNNNDLLAILNKIGNKFIYCCVINNN